MESFPIFLRANSRRRQRGSGSVADYERPTNNNTKTDTQAVEQTPRQRMDCYHQTSHQQPTAKVTRIHTYLCAQPHLGYHSISTTATSSLLETLTKTASCSPSSVSATLRPIHLCHQTPQRLPILLDSPLSPTPWVVAPRAAGAWGTRWRAPRQGTRIVPSVWLSAGPVVQDLACCAALVDASTVASPYHVHLSSQVASALAASLHVIFPPANCTLHARPLPTLRTLLQDCACESEMVGTDGRHRTKRT